MSGNEPVRLDLAPYIVSCGYRGVPMLRGRLVGLQAAKDLKVLTLTGRKLILVVPSGIDMDETFMRAFLGPLARKVGPAELDGNITVVGGYSGSTECWRTRKSLRESIGDYLIGEVASMAKRARKKAKVEKGPDWTEPLGFFIPEIATKISLVGDWKFRLHCESRNGGLYRQLPVPFSSSSGWLWDDRGNTGSTAEVTVAAGTVLSVDRVYIRKGVKEYSSITFNVSKGAVVRVDGKDIVLKSNARFWAKLSDVNKMTVRVDKATLAEN